MSVNVCCVPGCHTGLESTRKRNKLLGIKNPSMFVFPKDPFLFEKWKMSIPNRNKEVGEKSRICELHFLPEEIERYFITNMPDGTVYKLKKGRNSLRKGAIPSIFPGFNGATQKKFFVKKAMKISKAESGNKDSNLKEVSESKIVDFSVEEDSLSESKVMGLSAKEESASEIMKLSVEEKSVDVEEIPPIDSDVLVSIFHDYTCNSITPFKELNETNVSVEKNASSNPLCIIESIQTIKNIESFAAHNDFFKYLLENLNEIKKPNKWWSIIPFEESIICAKWTENYYAERRVIIEKDLNVKIFLKDSQVNASSGKKIEGLNDISYLLQEVNNLLLCPGIQPVSEKKCLLYYKRQPYRVKNLCEVCAKIKTLQDEEERKKMHKSASLTLNNQKLYNKMRCEKRKNARLLKKVAKLRGKLDYLQKNYKDFMAMAGM